MSILWLKYEDLPDLQKVVGILPVVSRVMRKIDFGIWQKSITGGGLTAPWLLHKRAGRKGSRAAGTRPGGKFCVSVFRQNQEYHIINVHDGAYSPWLHPSRKVGAVCAPRAA